jgi:hypothetical protein
MNTISCTSDVGPGGLFVETLSPSLEGTPVVLRVPGLTGTRELSGVVVRRETRGMGISLETGSWLGARALRPD